MNSRRHRQNVDWNFQGGTLSQNRDDVSRDVAAGSSAAELWSNPLADSAPLTSVDDG